MKKLFFTSISILSILVFNLPVRVFAVESPNPQTITTDNHTAREETEGKDVWEKLQAKQFECKNLNDDNFASLGEYFMGQSVGNTQRHAVMNQMMKNMMGEQGETQMHISLGKRSSGCDKNASFPSGYGFPMMGWMMGGGGNLMMGYGGWNNIMGGWSGFGLGWISMILFWGLLILAIIALLKWLLSGSKGQLSKTPLEVLKERYAKGEIDKKEFEQKKKDLE